ncbi:TauD/TfdA family dioxygenase [Ilumatobacter sp.]|uniref:TauD/TfdA family dioxygenase n=1 Tax=Ilumatobacter sp. TaxID=1967498 RepID=UPI003B52F65C
MTPIPSFARHERRPIATVERDGDVVTLGWADGASFTCLSEWLHEQSIGIDPSTREGTVEPSDLAPPGSLVGAFVDDGALRVEWATGERATVDPGWLRSIADGDHLPGSGVGRPRPWTASDLPEPPSFDGSRVLDDESVLEAWLGELCTTGLARLRSTPTTDDLMAELAARIGPIRGSNFGGVFTVESVVEPDSTANTGRALGQHTDLPTRETPPGFQFLHCVENTVAGGASRMADGLAVVEELRSNHPEAHEALTTLEWVFANRAPDGDHRWVAPLIDHGATGSPLTLRAFYPVRLAPHMPIEDQPRAYAAMRTFSAVAHDARFMITSVFEPGDLVGFDNRRILHGRDAFDPGVGRRRLRGCYIDRDDVLSRLRVLRRPGRAATPTAAAAAPATATPDPATPVAGAPPPPTRSIGGVAP